MNYIKYTLFLLVLLPHTFVAREEKPIEKIAIVAKEHIINEINRVKNFIDSDQYEVSSTSDASSNWESSEESSSDEKKIPSLIEPNQTKQNAEKYKTKNEEHTYTAMNKENYQAQLLLEEQRLMEEDIRLQNGIESLKLD